MKTLTIRCDHCNQPLVTRLSDAHMDLVCPDCATTIQIEVFPALLHGAAPGRLGESLLINDESSCFYHSANKAVVLCNACGRFLCALCDVEFQGQHLCPACIETGVKKEKLNHVRNDTTYYDSIALTLSLLSLFLIFSMGLGVLLVPVVLFISIRYWKKPVSVVPRSKLRFVVAMIIVTLLLAFVIFGIAIYFIGWFS